MAKNILGLDLGTTSLGFAYVKEAESKNETSSVEQIGVRISQLDNFVSTETGKESKDPLKDFISGKGISPNAGRTKKRGARRMLDRYQDRRKNLIEVLTKAGLINPETKLTEIGKNTTHNTWALRAKSSVDKIEKDEFARVLLAINKKRGYKSSRKAKNEDEGQAIDGMAVAKKLYDENLTPGQLVYQLLKVGKKSVPDFYRSDLQAEFDKVWNYQKLFYPEILTDEFYKELQGKGQRASSAMFWTKYKFNTAENKTKSREEKKLQAYKWRSEAITIQLEKEEVAYVITEINNNLNNSSGYLGAISDRSKELYFNNQTVGQYLYNQLKNNPHKSLKNQVFYRQDYLDEFDKIWNEQKKHHSELTDELKDKVRDIIIFFQRKLKSQKGLISFCEFESQEKLINGNLKTVGLRVAPKSSPLFQEFKIWQVLHNVLIRKKGNKKRVAKTTNQQNSFGKEQDIFVFDSETKQLLFDELNLKGNLKANKIFELLGYNSSEWEINYSELEGNRTNKVLYEAYLNILDKEGYDLRDLLKVKSDKDEVELNDLNVPSIEIKNMIKQIFESLNINTEILDFNGELDGKAFEEQKSYQLWHILYSYEGDNSQSGNEKLYEVLEKKFGFKREHSHILANIALPDDYGNLSTKAMRKIYSYIKENNYSTACELTGYRHSKNSLTREEIENRPLQDKLELLKKNSLRNPVVEKILNQMVNVVNTLIETNRINDPNFRFDEIRIELARELKKNAKEREDMTANINASKMAHEKISKLLQNEFAIKNPTRNDIIRYRLYEELKSRGYKDLYTDTYIPREILFSKQVDIEHIIPQSKLFDDSFSNKTIMFRQTNLEKGNQTAFDYILGKHGSTEDYESRIKALYELNQMNKEEGISKAKYQKLLKQESEIGDGFIERDLRESQYIAKKAKEMLLKITRSVVSTSGSITDRLREDWGLVNVMKELNLPKYRALELTEMQERKYGQEVEIIKDWTKRNDHRHHAMDALTVAFTKHIHIQYLNYLNARRDENHDLHKNIIAIENGETKIKIDDNGNKKRVFKEPMPNFRQIAKEHLETVLISHKAKNKVVTKNVNKANNDATSIIQHENSTEKTVKGQVLNTPRGQLHKETVYGKYRFYESKEEKVGTKFDLETIEKISNTFYKKTLLQRLSENGNDPKKAFGGKNALSKTPIYLNEAKTEKLPETVKLVWLTETYSIRKDINPDNFKDEKTIEKVVDEGVKRILKSRLKEFGNDPKRAFSDLEKKPIWFNKNKGISIKRVTISGVKNAEPLHYKKDHLGKDILEEKGNKIPVDFVSTGNNHHVAIYRDEKGLLQEKVVSFFEAVKRVNHNLPIIIINSKEAIDYVLETGINDEVILSNLPDKDWQFLFTMKQNEMFVFPNEITGFNPREVDLLDPKNKKLISPNLFRVQTLSVVKYGTNIIRDFKFRHHLESKLEDKKELHGVTFHQLKSLPPLEHIIKVRINHIGDIVSVGEKGI